MKRSILGLLAGLLLIGCSAPPIVQLPPVDSGLPEWVGIERGTLNGSECPDIEGKYQKISEIHLMGQEPNVWSEVNFARYGWYFPIYLAETYELEVSVEDNAADYFEIVQPDPSVFFLNLLNDPGTKLMQRVFRAAENDFICHSGSIEFPLREWFGYTEGGSVNTQTRNVLFVAESGALIIQSTKGPLRSRRATPESDFTQTFVRFPRVLTEPSGNNIHGKNN